MDNPWTKRSFPMTAGAKNEGVEIWLAHAAVEAVDRIGQWQPSSDQEVEILLTVGIEIYFNGECGIASGRRADAKTEMRWHSPACQLCVDSRPRFQRSLPKGGRWRSC